MNIYKTSNNEIIAEDVKLANNFISRSIGLISRKKIYDKEALVIKPCCSIHTFFMKFSIDVLFVDKNDKIIAIHRDIRPNKILPVYFKSEYVIEMKSQGTKDLSVGETITIK